MALQIGDKVTYAATSPFFYSKSIMEVVKVYELTKADIGKVRLSPGVHKMLKTKGKAQLTMVKCGTEQFSLPSRFFKKFNEK